MTTQRKIQRYGWKPDLPDHRDYTKYGDVIHVGVLPSKVDLTDKCPPVYDQGQLGSCTANAIAAAMQFDFMRQNIGSWFPSRLYIYYNERQIEGTIDFDNGASLRDGIKSVANLGVCDEKEWPYDVNQFKVKPSPICYADGLKNKALSYAKVSNNIIPSLLKLCLSEGNPFVFGFTVYESFETQEVANTGEVPMPGPNEQVIGGHAVLCVGYDDSTKRFICRNSWGPNWGNKGYFTIPYDYLVNKNLASDFWTIKTVQ